MRIMYYRHNPVVDIHRLACKYCLFYDNKTKECRIPVCYCIAECMEAGYYTRKDIKVEIKINKEIRDYTESIFFGLSLRQFIFSLLAVFAAAGLYFLLRGSLGTEMVSWVCIVGAFPFAALGFIRYNGLYFEQLIAAVIRSEFMTPDKLLFNSKNLYHETVQDLIEAQRKEIKKSNA